MKVLITAGGGGHFSPALAIIAALPKNVEYVIVGRKFTYEGSSTLSHEYLFSEKNQLPFIPLTTGRLQRTFTKFTIPSLLKIPIGFLQAKKIINDFKPDVVVSFGGYVTVPVVIAAQQKKIPVIIHEQTQEVGLANKIASRFATKICLSWESSKRYFPKEKIVLTGNPVKPELAELLKTPKKKHTIPHIFVTGGSQGSHKINTLIKDSLPELLKIVTITHQTGDAQEFDDFTQLSLIKEGMSTLEKDRYHLYKFLGTKEMLDAVSQADLVISRCGINTLTELLLLKKPALLMPIKDGQKNEQEKNAKMFVSAGLGEMVDQDVITVSEFTQIVQKMVKNVNGYKLSSNIPEISLHLSAAERLTELIMHVGNQTKNQTG